MYYLDTFVTIETSKGQNEFVTEEQETKKGLKKEFAFELNLHLNLARGEVINAGKILQ